VNSSRNLWRVLASVSVIGTIVLMISFVYAIRIVVFPQGGVIQGTIEPPEPIQDDASLQIVALGDSITVGFGDTTGKGYVKNLQELLAEERSEPVYVVGNFAQNGYTTAQVLADLTDRSGIQQAVKNADILLLTAGGNDLFRMGDEIDVKAFQDKIPTTQATLQNIFSKINDLNSDLTIYYIALFNPFIEAIEIEGTSLAVQAWNDAAFQAAEPYDNIVIVPSYDLFEQKMGDFLSSDNYHLNDAGYLKIAMRLAMLIE
jgi:lysophospholipase L1-like esterase